MVLAATIITLFLTLIIFYYNFPNNKNAVLLGGVLITLGIAVLIHYFTIYAPNQFWIAILVGNTIPIVFLTGPFLYLYTRNTLEDSKRFSKFDYLHFLPFVITLISIFPYYFVSFDDKLRFAQSLIDQPSLIMKINLGWLYPSYLNIIFRPLLLLAYMTQSIKLIYIHFKKKKNMQLKKKQEEISFKWLLLINGTIALMLFGYIYFVLYFFNIYPLKTINSSKFYYVLGILFSLVPVSILFFPEFLYGRQINKIKRKPQIREFSEYHESLVTTAALILNFVKKEENLLNSAFSIADIGDALNLKSKDIQYCFTTILKTKFTTLRKELRVELAKKELSSGKLISQSMEGVWMKSGFSSKTNFFISFKEVTGMTPIEYLNTIEQDLQTVTNFK
jgi:AraC-like DNA-binding protein